MNINPLTSIQRNYAIARLGEGLTPRAVKTMHETLSDGHVRSCYEGVFNEPVPADAEIVKREAVMNPKPMEKAA